MSESNRHAKKSYPNGLGVGSVPVLFTLRNVQPNIVSGIANSKTNATAIETHSTAVGVTSTHMPTTSSASVATAAPKEASPIKVSAATNNNRSFNAAVALLLVALCLIVIRNMQGTKTHSKGTIASNGGQINPSDAKSLATTPVTATSVAVPKVEMVPQLTINSNELKPLDLGQPNIPALAIANPAALPTQTLTTTTLHSELTGESKNEQSLTHAKPALLEPSTQPTTSREAKPAIESPVHFSNTAESGAFSLGPRLASNPALLQSTAPTAQPSQPGIEPSAVSMNGLNVPNNLNSLAGQTLGSDRGSEVAAIAETNEPTMATKDVIDLYQRFNKSATSTSNGSFRSPEPATQGVPAIAISNVAPRVENSPTAVANPPQTKPNAMLSGQSYPPTTKEYTPVTIPAYELDAVGSRQGAGSTPSSSMIRQPTSGSNRYPAYKPISQPQSGNSIGFPPNPSGN